MMTLSYPHFKRYECELCKCPVEVHFTSYDYYETHRGTETITVKERKEKYDIAQSAQINVEKIIKQITHELEKVRKIAYEKLFSIHKCIQRINEISLQPNQITELDYISTLIASENAEQTEGYTIRSEFYQKILQELETCTTMV